MEFGPPSRRQNTPPVLALFPGPRYQGPFLRSWLQSVFQLVCFSCRPPLKLPSRRSSFLMLERLSLKGFEQALMPSKRFYPRERYSKNRLISGIQFFVWLARTHLATPAYRLERIRRILEQIASCRRRSLFQESDIITCSVGEFNAIAGSYDGTPKGEPASFGKKCA